MSEKSDLLRKQTQECIDRCFDDIDALRAERDALRARIDSAGVMTATRNGVIRTDTGAFDPGKRVALVPLDD